MVSYERMQSGGIGHFQDFYAKWLFGKPDCSHFPTENIKIDHIWTEYDHILPFTNQNQLYFDSGLFIKLQT